MIFNAKGWHNGKGEGKTAFANTGGGRGFGARVVGPIGARGNAGDGCGGGQPAFGWESRGLGHGHMHAIANGNGRSDAVPHPPIVCTQGTFDGQLIYQLLEVRT